MQKKLRDGLGITSIVQYGWWFEEHSLKDWFHSHAEWATNAPLFIGMAWALRTCVKMTEAKKNNQEQLKDDDKIPMDPILNKSIDEAWNKMYHVPMAPSQEFTSQILNRMYHFGRIGWTIPRTLSEAKTVLTSAVAS